jgi:thymidylate synthase ThyX
MKTKINAQIVAHSVNEQGDELISVLATFPRIILAEVNTHRMLSKNTSSSRAIPFKKMVETIKEDPFIPIAWQKEHKGMQGSEYFENTMLQQELWLEARNSAVDLADRLNSGCGVTKQLCNRLLEPFMWTTMLITGPKSGWDNFFKLRCPAYSIQELIDGDLRTFRSKKDFLKELDYDPIFPNTNLDWLKVNKGQAEIHIMALAECIWDAYNESTPKVLKAGEWHIPFENKIIEILANPDSGNHSVGQQWTKDKVFVSTAMGARTSYTVVGEEKGIDYEAMIGLHDRLLAQDPPHSSPLEHCAKAMSEAERQMYRKVEKAKSDSEGLGWCNNLKGFIPYRYMVDNGIEI